MHVHCADSAYNHAVRTCRTPATTVMLKSFTFAISAALMTSVPCYSQWSRPATATVTTFPLPNPGSLAYGIAAGPDGNVWFAELAGRIGRITPAGIITEFAPDEHVSLGYAITSGPDGNLWFRAGGEVGRITPSGNFSFFDPGLDTPNPLDIVAGPDGNLWVSATEAVPCFPDCAVFNQSRVLRLKPSGVFDRSFLLTRPNVEIGRIARGVNNDLWFTENRDRHIGHITADGVITEFDTFLPTGTVLLNGGWWTYETTGIAVASNGDVWFIRTSLFKMTPQGALTLVSDGGAGSVCIGPDQTVWFTTGWRSSDTFHSAIAFVKDGVVTSVPLPDGVIAGNITVGPDGNVWFTDVFANSIGKLDVSTIAPIPTRRRVISR